MRVVLLEEMRCDGMSKLVACDRDLVTLGVLDWNRKTRFYVAHRLADVLPVQRVAAIFKRVQERQRQDLLDVGRRVAIGDASEFLAPIRCVEGGVVLLLVEVEGRDVLAVLAVWQSEHDLPSESSWPRKGFIEDGRSVGGADEQHVVVGCLERRDAQMDAGAVEGDDP